jgi:hypothetical protein
MNRIPVLLLLGFVLLFGCQRQIGWFGKEGLIIDPFDFEYMTAKARIKYDDGKKDLAGSANIRIQKGNAIWMSVSPGLGVEVARILIDRDSVQMIDRINKLHLKLGYEQISNDYGIDINYNLIESVMIGNLIFPYEKENLVRSKGGISYRQVFDTFIFDNFIGTDSKKLERLDVQDVETKTAISVDYGEFKPVGEEVFPFTINARLETLESTKQSTNIRIGFNKAEIEDKPLKFPFSVPSKYRVL